MKKVILIDDEPMVLESIQAGIDWEGLGLEVDARFTDAMEALCYVQNHSVDIVVTDIAMPPFNGLILCSRIQEVQPLARFVIISGYADFAYAQKAMQLDAVGYCLKPIDYRELSGYLKKAAGSIASVLTYDFIEYLYENNVEQLREYLVTKNIREPYYLAVATGKDSISDLTGGFCCSTGLQEYLYISDAPLKVVLTEERLAGRELRGVALSEQPVPCEKLQAQTFQLMYDSYQSFFQPSRLVFRTPCTYCDEVIEGVRGLLHQPVELEEFLLGQKEKMTHIFQAADIYNLIYQEAGGESNRYTYKQLAFAYRDYEEMVKSLGEMARTGMVRTETESIPDSGNRNFLKIIKFIHENYTKDISIKSIVDQFYLNPCYISQLFKKETGKTFVRYLTALRIGRAEELLATTDLPINRISEECGFNDSFYFIKIFKKYTDKAPSDYRKSVRTSD